MRDRVVAMYCGLSRAGSWTVLSHRATGLVQRSEQLREGETEPWQHVPALQLFATVRTQPPLGTIQGVDADGAA